jgi:trehalose-phosphatase
VPGHASDQVSEWVSRWHAAGHLALLLDFDGTLAPIVADPASAFIPGATRNAIERLRRQPGVRIGIISGRRVSDVRARVGIGELFYAGNHGMEIEGPQLRRIHEEALTYRPALEEAIRELGPRLRTFDGVLLEDKGLTLTVHYRRARVRDIPRLRADVTSVVRRVAGLRITEGKKVLEVRPDVSWDKGSAVEFLLGHLELSPETPLLYVGDDRTDEPAFGAVQARPYGEAIIVAEAPVPGTVARWYLRGTDEVRVLLETLAATAPESGA